MKPATPVLKKAPNVFQTMFAKDQAEYLALPAVRSEDGLVTTRWELTWRERFAMLFRGSLYLQVMTFNNELQPVKMMVDEPGCAECGGLRRVEFPKQDAPTGFEYKFDVTTDEFKLVSVSGGGGAEGMMSSIIPKVPMPKGAAIPKAY